MRIQVFCFGGFAFGLIILSNENETDAFSEIYFTSNDGLTLFARDYARHHTEATPVVCLHGFTGNSQDFHEIALPIISNSAAPTFRI